MRIRTNNPLVKRSQGNVSLLQASRSQYSP
jgi:hypothetical protein